jgi:Uma2 family endonuclease
MITANSPLPATLLEFMNWEPNDGFKYEWNDGEVIKFAGMNKTQFHIYTLLNRLFISKGYWKKGTFVAEQDVQLSGIQMRRPDMAYFTIEQEARMKNGSDEIPAFVVEVISGNDNINQVEEKIIEYFKAGVKIVWLVLPESKSVHVYTSRKEVKICTDSDTCSAAPILPDFEVSVNELFG